MRRRSWILTSLLGVVAIGCATVAVIAGEQHSDAQQRRDDAEAQVSEAETGLDSLRSQAADQQDTLTDLDAQTAVLHSMFTPEVLDAVTQVQAEAITGACDTARTATRGDAPPPTGEQAIAYAAATAPAGHEPLEGLPARWGRMLDPSVVQAEIDRCAADEQAAIEAERQAAADAAAAESARLDSAPPCDPSQLSITSPIRGTYCVND